MTRATVHKGPKGGIEYRLWTGESTFVVVGKFKARPHMTPDEIAKADTMETERKTAQGKERETAATWRYIQRGG